MRRDEINIRDPFVLLYDNTYYMYGTRVGGEPGFDVYKSDDLETWSEGREVFGLSPDFWGKKNFWAPEVHLYNGKFYMFASFKSDDACRGTSILVSDKPDGKFEVWAERITPPDWECLDGTFYIENGEPYMVFCHEWLQIKDGEILSVKLSKDLKSAVGDPVLLFKASSAKWISSVTGEGNFVTDGPFLFNDKDGKLKTLWSSFSKGEYVLATATSSNGSINGEWTVDDELIYEKDGGHGMIFETKNKERMISLHAPNSSYNERPSFLKF